LPSEFDTDWQLVYENWLAFEDYTRQVVLSDVPPEDTSASSGQRQLGEKLIASSDVLVTILGEYSKRISSELVGLQIALATLNIAVHLVMLYLIIRILQPVRLLTGATNQIKAGNLDVSLVPKGNDELWKLVGSFDSMIKTLRVSSHRLGMEQQKYRDLFDGAPDLYRMVNRKGIVLDCNAAYVNSLGYSHKSELIGKSILENTAEMSLDAMQKAFETWKRTGLIENIEIWMKRKDGSTFPTLISATATCVYHDNREIVASNTCIIDATKILQAKQKLEDANKRLIEVDRMKTEFISVASHELRTPIQPILNFALMAERGAIDSSVALRQIIKEARRLQHLATDILDVSRIEGGNLTLTLEQFSINDLIREISNIYELDVTVPIKLLLAPETEDVRINADRQRLAQALSNLVGNAKKFTKSGHITISTRTVLDAKYVETCISDTGAGIPSEIVQSLFTKFASKSVARGAEHGTGLGLYISKAIIMAHGGNIVGYNNPEVGATFKIWLPRFAKARNTSSIAE
jgi:PAS domain S-box-containing protein